MNLGWVSLLLVFALLAAGVACAADGDYRLGPEDVVAITVLYHPEFSVEMATIRPDGKINYPLAGDIEAAGKTVAEVAEIIRQAVGRDVRDRGQGRAGAAGLGAPGEQVHQPGLCARRCAHAWRRRGQGHGNGR